MAQRPDDAAGADCSRCCAVQRVLHATQSRHPSRARYRVVRLSALRPGHVAAVAWRSPVRHADGPQHVRRSHVIHPAVPRSAVLGCSGCVDHVLCPVSGNRRRGDPDLLVWPQPPRVGVDGARRRSRLPGPSCGRLDEPRELPPRRIPRGTRRLCDLWRARTQMARVRRFRCVFAHGERGRVARDRSARNLGGATP